MQIRPWVVLLGCFVLGFAGGSFSKILSPLVAFAQNTRSTITTTQELRLMDAVGKISGRWMATYNGGSGIFMFDDKGRSRLELNLFPDGRPLIALNDEKHLCKLLLKLEWEKNIPMFFMKEPADRNRLIMALDLKNSDIPFLVLFDAKGQKREIFGKFEMP